MGRWFGNVCVAFLAGAVRLALNAAMVLLGMAQPVCWVMVAIFTIRHFWLGTPGWEPLFWVGISFAAFVVLAAVAVMERTFKNSVEAWLARAPAQQPGTPAHGL